MSKFLKLVEDINQQIQDGLDETEPVDPTVASPEAPPAEMTPEGEKTLIELTKNAWSTLAQNLPPDKQSEKTQILQVLSQIQSDTNPKEAINQLSGLSSIFTSAEETADMLADVSGPGM